MIVESHGTVDNKVHGADYLNLRLKLNILDLSLVLILGHSSISRIMSDFLVLTASLNMKAVVSALSVKSVE